MEPVGTPIDFKYSQKNAGKIIGALRDLHNLEIAHGDARIQNLLLVGSELLWVDFMQVPDMTEAEKQRDAQTLCKSMDMGATEYDKFLCQQ